MNVFYITLGILGFLAGEVATQFWIHDRYLLRAIGVTWMLLWFYAVYRRN